jgi:hypothetical protein
MVVVAASIAATPFLAGCVLQSIHPICGVKDTVFDAGLLGTWSEASARDGETWRFSTRSGAGYWLLIADGRDSTLLQADLTRIDGRMYLDLYLGDRMSADVPVREFFMLPVHGFMRIRREGSGWAMAWPNADSCKAYLDRHPRAVRHEWVASESEVVLTDATPRLRDFIAVFARTPGAFVKESVLRRVGTEP